MHACNVIAFFVWAWPTFVTEAVPLGELLHEALFGLTGVSTPRTLIQDFASPPYLELPTRLKWVGKNVQTPKSGE